MSDINETLRAELKDPEYSEGYAESFLDSYVATQIKVLREQAGLSQQGLAEIIGTKQGAISRIEDVNYSQWSISTLKKLARAFRVRLKVSFETYGSLITEVETFSRASLERVPRENDPGLHSTRLATTSPLSRHLKLLPKRKIGADPKSPNAPGHLQQKYFCAPPPSAAEIQFQVRSPRPPASSARESIMGVAS